MSNKYTIQNVVTYRVPTVADVENLHEELLNNNNFDLVAFSYKTKYIKSKGQIVEEYQLVQAKMVFNDEKDPERHINIVYEVDF